LKTLSVTNPGINPGLTHPNGPGVKSALLPRSSELEG